MNGNHGDVPIIGRTQQVVVHTQLIIAPGMVEVRDGGLSVERCEHHLRMIDLPHGTAWLLPLTDQMVDELWKTLDQIRDERPSAA